MLTNSDKFFVAVLVLGGNAVRSRYGIDFGVTDQLAYDIVNGIAAGLIWLCPNKKGA
mgnify:CR=1 FL=1